MIEPLPPYVGALALAEKLGVRVSQAECLEDVEPYWLYAAQAVMLAEQQVQEARAAQAKRTK